VPERSIAAVEAKGQAVDTIRCKKAGQGLDKAVFLGVGERGEKAPFGGVFQGAEQSRRGVPQDCGAAVLPEVKEAAAVLGVKVEVTGPEYGRDKA
jgi:hypothetical protein